MELIIDREKWLRGGKGVLLVGRYWRSKEEEEGKMCCLGFLALECGFKKKNIIDKGTYVELRKRHPKLSKRLPEALQVVARDDDEQEPWRDTEISNKLMTLNDTSIISDKMREYKLKRKFKSIGIDVTFIN